MSSEWSAGSAERGRFADWARMAERFGMVHPIIQAPMGGGPTTPALVAAVSNTGALGSVAGGYLDLEQLANDLAAVRRITDRAFSVNFFAGVDPVAANSAGAEGAGAGQDTDPMLELLSRWHRLLDVPPPTLLPVPQTPISDQIDVALAADVAAVSFTFGIPSADDIARLRRRGVFLLGTATTVNEARHIEAAGMDAVVVQGSEAGAHRGTFAGPFEAAMVGTLALVPQVVDAVAIPVIASGGIMDGRGIVAAQALGAAAVQMGTAFLVADEAGTSSTYRDRILTARDDETTITRAFSGRPARGVRNAFIDEVEAAGVPIPPYPVQHHLTRPMRAAAARAGRADALSLWAGQGVGLARSGPAAQLIERWAHEADLVRRSLSASHDTPTRAARDA